METVNAFSVGIVCGDNPALYDCAAVIQRRLSRYRISKHIRTQYGYLAEIEVFRPGEDWKNWDRLIVIVSPDTRNDPFLDACIRRFCQERNQHFIATVTALGDPTEAIPPLLLVDYESGLPMEPLTSDWTNPTRQTANVETTRLMAGILSCPFDTLRRRHARFVFQLLAAATASLSLFLMVFAAFTLYSSQVLNRQTQSVYRNESRYFVTKSTAALEAGNGREAVRCALAALPDGEISRPLLPEALEALAQVLTRNDDVYLPYAALVHDGEIVDFAVSQDQTLLVSLTGKKLLFWDLTTQELIFSHTLGKDSNISSLHLYDMIFLLGTRAVYRYSYNTVQCFDLESRTVLWTEKLDSSIQSIDAQGNNIFCRCTPTEESALADLYYLDASTGTRKNDCHVYPPENDTAYYLMDVSLSPDGNYAAILCKEKETQWASVIIWDLKSSTPFLLSEVLNGVDEIPFTEHSTLFLDNTHLLFPNNHGGLINFDLSDNTTVWTIPSVADESSLSLLPVQYILESGQEVPAVCCTESDTKYCLLAADTGARLESGESERIVDTVEDRFRYNKSSEPPIWNAGKGPLTATAGISQINISHFRANSYLTERFSVSISDSDKKTLCLYAKNSYAPYAVTDRVPSGLCYFHGQEQILDLSDGCLRIGPEKTLEYTLPGPSDCIGILEDGSILCREDQNSSDSGSLTFYLLSPDSDTVETRNLVLPISEYEITSQLITGDGVMLVAHELSTDSSFRYYWNIQTGALQAFPSGRMISAGDNTHFLFLPDSAEQNEVHVCTYRDGQWTIGDLLEYNGNPAIPNNIMRYGVDTLYNSQKDQWLIPTAEQVYYLISEAGAVPVEFDGSYFAHSIQNIGFSPDGTQLRIDCMNREIYCFDTTTGKLVETVSVTPQTDVHVPDGTDWEGSDQYMILKGYSANVAYPIGNLASFVPLHFRGYSVAMNPYQKKYFFWSVQYHIQQAPSQEALVSLGKAFIQDGYLIGNTAAAIS